MKSLKVAFISTYLPRQCGIATFTSDLLHSLHRVYNEAHSDNGDSGRLEVVALDKASLYLSYPPEVHFEIRDQHESDYRDAAEFLNLSPVEVVSLQHEFGIFGGDWGGHVLHLLENLKKPVVTTLHTISYEPTPEQKKILHEVCSLSTLVIAQSETGVKILKEVYGVPESNIRMIYHGVPDIPFLDPDFYKDQFQAEGRFVILTFGFLSPNKGIEYAINALPEIVKKFPQVLYFVVGITHPEIKSKSGEKYRLLLEKQVEEKELGEYVIFHNRFLSYDRLIQFLVAADVYLAPYLSREQIVSGTLSYALACGKVIISTPSWYAEELLSNGRGLLVPFRDSKSISEALFRVLNDEGRLNRIRKEAYQFSRKMIWSKVATRYAGVFEEALLKHRKGLKPKKAFTKIVKLIPLPEIDLSHLKRLTDDTGILQHAIFPVPDRFHGYTTDDNARALLVSFMNWELFKDKGIIKFMDVYLAFLNYALDSETHRVRNFMSYERKWQEKIGSEDSHGRVIMALGYGASCDLPEGILELVIRLFRQVLKPSLSLSFPRALSFSIIGCLDYLKRFPGDREVKEVVLELADRLYKMFKLNATGEWPWCEDIVTYENGRLPEALILAGYQLKKEEILQQGLKSLNWLLNVQTDSSNRHLSIIGNKGWFKKGKEKAHFDQQPVEASALLDASYAALLATGDSRWEESIKISFNWFLGRNDMGMMLYDFTTGGCFDGLLPGGVNQNQGAESTLSWLLALHRMHEIVQKGNFLKEGKTK